MPLRHCLSVALLLLSAWASAAPSATITSPAPLPADDARPRVFLAGSIDNGRATDWQAENSRRLHLVAGLLMLAAGIAVFVW